MSEQDAETTTRQPSPRTAGNGCGCAGGSGRAISRLPLSQDRIVDAALAYVDSNCLDELSMRRLGSELGVEAMSLYRYFPSKAALLDAVVCQVLADLRLPDDGAGVEWEPHVRAYARSFRAIARRHPRLYPLLATVGPANSTLMRVTARMVRLWQEAGLDSWTAARAQCALQGFITGSSLWEIMTADDARPDHRAGLRIVEAGDATPGAVACTPDADADFEFGLDALLAGLRARVEPA